MSELNIRLLGPPNIDVDGKPLEVDTRKAIALLSYLAVTGQGHARDTLATLLWPESDQSRARAALRRTLSTLNRALGNGWVKSDRSMLVLESSEGVQLDVASFKSLLGRVDRHEHEAGEECGECISWLEKAVELYRDDFMAGFTLRDSPGFDEWQVFESQSLQRDYARSLDQLTRRYARAGRLIEAIEAAERLLSSDPLNETAHRHLMELYARRGDRAVALRQYRTCVRVLQEELGVAPLEETTSLYEDIQEERISAEASPPGLVVHSDVETTDQAAGGAGTDLPLVGRGDEIETIWQRYDSSGDRGHFVVVEGEAGVGKTRLVEETTVLLEAHGARVARAICYEGEADLAYGTLAEGLGSVLDPGQEWWQQVPRGALAEATRLLPALAAELPEPPTLPALDSPGARTRFYEAISEILVNMDASERPGVLVVDNFHWADEATQELLAYLVRRLQDRPLFVVATWRTERVPDDHRFRRWLAQARTADTGTHIQLARLTRSGVQEMVKDLQERGVDLPGELAGRLYEVSEGLPFFIAEYLAVIRENLEEAGELQWEVPRGVRELLEARLNDLNETETQLLSTAAVIGRSFEYDVLREASGRAEEETVRGVEALQGRGLIVELGEALGGQGPSYDFKHEQLRSVVLSRTSQARQRLLHGRVAQALVGWSRGSGKGALASRVAHHFALAGQPEHAAEYFKRAGDRARDLFANTEALTHYQEALSLGHPDSAELYEEIGDLRTLLGQYNRALASYEAALSYLAPEESGRIEHKIGGVYHRRGDWEQAGRHFEAAAETMEPGKSSADRSRVLADWSLSCHQAGQRERAHGLAEEGLELAERSGDQRAEAQIHNILGILARSSGDLEQAESHLADSLKAAEATGDPFARAAALNNWALLQADFDKIDQALETAKQALELCKSHGDRHREGALQSTIADLLHAAGRTQEAMSHMKESARIMAEIGLEEGSYRPEIWKLVEW